jgi:hypothetical protein
MDNQVRIFRKNPIAWWDKNAMRQLRKKFGKDKKTFVILRSVYLALCEIESDFAGAAINFFTQTVGTYAGTSRQVAGKYINLLEQLDLIKKTRFKDPKTKKFLAGTSIEILAVEGKENNDSASESPVAGYPTNGVSHQRGIRPALKNISQDKKVNFANNVNGNLTIQKGKTDNGIASLRDILTQYGLEGSGRGVKPSQNRVKPEQYAKRDYIATELARDFDDTKSLGCYRAIAEKVPDHVIYEVRSAVIDAHRNGTIRESRGALFVGIIQDYCAKHGIDLGFQTYVPTSEAP